MPAYMYVHPLFGALTVILILTAAGIKMKWHKTGNLHYAAGLTALIAALTAAGVAFLAVRRFLAEGASLADLPPTFMPHAVAASLGIIVLLVQAVMGASMYLSRQRKPALLPFHRRNAKVLIALTVIIFLLGLATVIIMVINEYL